MAATIIAFTAAIPQARTFATIAPTITPTILKGNPQLDRVD